MALSITWRKIAGLAGFTESLCSGRPQCNVCRQTFLCTSNRAKLQEHIDGKHAGKNPTSFEVSLQHCALACIIGLFCWCTERRHQCSMCGVQHYIQADASVSALRSNASRDSLDRVIGSYQAVCRARRSVELLGQRRCLRVGPGGSHVCRSILSVGHVR